MKKTLLIGILAVIAGLGFSPALWAEVGVTDTEIVIGSHQDLSGPIAGWGTQVKNGMDMRAREINEAGGINGRKLRIVFEDNAYDPKKAIMATNKMIARDKVFVFVGNMGSPTAGATLPIIIRKKIPHLFPLTAASIFFDPFNRYKFALFVPYYSQARAIVKYFVKGDKQYKRIGIMYQDDEMGAIMLSGARDQLASYNMKLAAAESYKRGATEFSTQIAKLRKANVQLVILATIIRETVGALKEAKKIGWDVDMVGMTPAFTQYVPLLAKKAGFSADGFYCTGQTPYPYPDSEDPFIREWHRKYKEMFNKVADLPVSAGYDAITYFATAAKRAGRDLTREKLIDALETFRGEASRLGGPPVSFTKTNHLGADRVFMAQVRGGRYIKISDYIDYKK